MLNETIVEMVNALTPAGVIWWIKVLAIIGFIWLVQTIFKSGVHLVYLIAYIYGTIVWLVDKIRGKKND